MSWRHRCLPAGRPPLTDGQMVCYVSWWRHSSWPTAIILPKHFSSEFLHLIFSWNKSSVISQVATLPVSCLHSQGRMVFFSGCLEAQWLLARKELSPARLPPGNLSPWITVGFHLHYLEWQCCQHPGGVLEQPDGGWIFLLLISFHLIAVQVWGWGELFLSTPPDFHCSSTFLQKPLKWLPRLRELRRGKIVDSIHLIDIDWAPTMCRQLHQALRVQEWTKPSSCSSGSYILVNKETSVESVKCRGGAGKERYSRLRYKGSNGDQPMSDG